MPDLYIQQTGNNVSLSFQKIGQGFQRLLSHIEDDDGTNDEKSAEKIFKKMTKVKKLGTAHKKSIAAIAKLQKQKQGTRARGKVKMFTSFQCALININW